MVLQGKPVTFSDMGMLFHVKIVVLHIYYRVQKLLAIGLNYQLKSGPFLV